MFNKVGRKVYFDLETGNVILDTGERQGAVVQTTLDQDVATFPALSERKDGSYGVIEFEFGEYAEDFAQCNGYRIDPKTREIEFSYPDGSDQPKPAFTKPLTKQVAELEAANAQLKKRVDSSESAIMALMDLQLM